MNQKIASALVALAVLSGFVPALAAGNWKPGLVQARFLGGLGSTPPEWKTDLLNTVGRADLDVTAGPLMATVHHASAGGEIANTFNGSTKTWKWANNSIYAYEGQIYLQGGVTYQFWQQVDDGAAIRINGEVVVSATSTSGSKGGSSGFYNPTETGWYDLNIMVWNGTYGTGPKADHYGIAFSTNVTEQVSESFLPLGTEGWYALEDDGNGTFLQHDAGEEEQEVAALVTTCMPSEDEVGELYFQDKKLSLVKDVILTGYQKFGNIVDTREYCWSDGPLLNAGDYTKSGLYLLANDGNVLTVEFHGMNAYGADYNGIGNGFELKLTQVGDDIYGKVTWVAGFTQANPIFDQTWAGKAGSLSTYNSTSTTYSTAGTNLKLVFRVPLDISRTVTFVDKEGATISTYVVPAGEVKAVEPEPPVFEGYVFYAWDKNFDVVGEDMTVTALYHRLCTVTFVDSDGTVLKTETVEETHKATPPDMTDRTYEGRPFKEWDVDYSNVTGDLKVTAVYHRMFTVTFVNPDGTELETPQAVKENYAATAPDMTDRKYNGAPFKEWNVDFSNVTGDLTVTAVYYDMHTVTFVNPDGEELQTELVADTFAATAPDMTGKTYKGEAFLGWDVEFSCITGDLKVTATYGTVPDAVQAVVDAGTLPADALIWYDEANDVWDDTTKNWYTPKGLITKWVPGKIAVFVTADTVAVSGEQSPGGILLAAHATAVTLTGDPLNFGAAATVSFAAGSVLRFENTVGGADGLTVTTAEGVTDPCSVEIAGDYQLTGTLTIENVTFKTVETGLLGSGTFKQSTVVKKGGVLSLESTAEQKMSGAIECKDDGYVITQLGSKATFNSGMAKNWDFRIAGFTYVTGYQTLPQDPNNTTVLSGGTLEMGSFYSDWGPHTFNHHNNGLMVMTNGVVRLTKEESIGSIMKTYVIGGSVTNLSEKPPLLHRFYMSDGASFTGTGVKVGYNAYYNTWSYIEVGGEEPSTFDAESILIGHQTTARGDRDPIGIKFDVADVTGDAATDFTVSSKIIENEGVTYNEGCRPSLGVYKTGEGTLELTGAGSSCTTGVFRVKAGTVRFAETCRGDFGALLLEGDSTLDCAGGKMTFADSRDMVWTEGATLTITGNWTKRTFRFGTSGEALTPEQLAQIRCVRASGRTSAVGLSNDGYLIPPWAGYSVILR